MKKIYLTIIAAAAAALAGCSDILDPLPSGYYNGDNYEQYPSLMRGLLSKGYSLMPTSYNGTEFAYLDCASDNAVSTSKTHAMRLLAVGTLQRSSDPFASWWGRDYEAIYYANRFLDDNKGFNMRYSLNPQLDSLQRWSYQGDAYALRAWYEFDLLRKFGGKAVDGRYLGFPIVTDPVVSMGQITSDMKRNTYEECMRQIVADCDSACVYLPLANRDQLAEDLTQQGALRWHRFDAISMVAVKAMAYLVWASPAFNPENDMSRWEKAAEYAAEVIRFKLEVDGAQLKAFDPANRFLWTDPNSPEIIFSSCHSSNSTMETMFYPVGFRGNANVGATQDLVDAFPMANGYPIDDPRSGYDAAKPYENRDPRFYATLFYHGSEVRRGSNGQVMYTFDMSENGLDMAGAEKRSMTNYYIKKFLNPDWNASDATVNTQPKSIFYIRWAHMCLAFAEAANRVVGPTDETRFGYSARQAIAWLRARQTNDGANGLGAAGDPYLDECAAAGRDAFEKLVRNERRIELCFEGDRFFDMRRWATGVEQLNVPVHKAVITTSDDGSYSCASEEVEPRKFTSLFIPIPYTEMRRSPGMVQNAGWESWN